MNDSPRLETPGDVSVYSSIEAAELALEPHDVSDANIHALDSEGRLLKIAVSLNGRKVVLQRAEDSPSHLDHLRLLLQAHARELGVGGEVEAMSISQLLNEALRRSPNPYT